MEEQDFIDWLWYSTKTYFYHISFAALDLTNVIKVYKGFK